MWIISGRFRRVWIPLRMLFHPAVVLLFEFLGALFMGPAGETTLLPD